MSKSASENWRQKLQGHPPGTVLAYERFRENRDPAHLNALVFEILRYHHADPASLSPENMHDQIHLSQDMGMDSVAMIESVFLLEDLLGISIPNADLEKLQTLGDLRDYLRQRLREIDGESPPA